MKIALFGYDGDPLREAVATGLRRHGCDVIGQTLSCFSPAQPLRDANGVLVCGSHGLARDVAGFYAKRSVPAAVIEPGWLPASRPEYRVGEKLAAAPSATRLAALGLAPAAARPRRDGDHVLILGQRTGSPTHGRSRKQFEDWAAGVAGRLRSVDSSPILWRPHPEDFWTVPGLDVSDPRTGDLATAIRGAWLVVAWNSTAILDAILARLPVIVEGPSPFAELGGTIAGLKDVAPVSDARLDDLLGTLAASQFSLPELADGKVLEVFLDQFAPEVVAAPASPDVALELRGVAAAPLSPRPAGPADDLTSIAGVGASTVKLLNDAGIRTFADLAAAPAERLDALELSPRAIGGLRKWRGEEAEA